MSKRKNWAERRQEVWMPCPDYEGWYNVSSFGRVMRTADGHSTFAGRIKKLKRSNTTGSMTVSLSRHGRVKRVDVAPLVCLAFHGERPDANHRVTHLDGDPRHNYSSNLRWEPANKAPRLHRRKLRGDQCRQIAHQRRDKSAVELAEQYGVSVATIYRIWAAVGSGE
jgi:hypothetical protein